MNILILLTLYCKLDSQLNKVSKCYWYYYSTLIDKHRQYCLNSESETERYRKKNRLLLMRPYCRQGNQLDMTYK